MLLTDLERANLRELQLKIIDCYNKKGGDGVKALIMEFGKHPANSIGAKWTASNWAFIANGVKSLPLKLEMFEQVLRLDRDNVYYRTSYAHTLVKAKKSEKAIPIFAKITLDNPLDSKALTAYGNALIRSSDYTQAFTILEKALLIDPNNTITLTSYANALVEKGDTAKAFELFERSLKLEADDTTTLTSYANALAGYGETVKAFELFESFFGT
jgi:Flp pilus assembly protein TadD, contains TPR repeats